jgi:hypothetical protein
MQESIMLLESWDTHVQTFTTGFLQNQLILAPEDTHQQSQLRYSQQESTKPIPGRYLKRIRTFSIVAIDHSVRKVIQISHPHASLSIALWTGSLLALIFQTTAMRWFWDIKQFYESSSPGLKSFSLRFVETYLKVYNLSVQTMEQCPTIRTREYKRQRSPFPHSPHNFAKTRSLNSLNPLGHFCTARILERKKSITYSKGRVPNVLRTREIVCKWSIPTKSCQTRILAHPLLLIKPQNSLILVPKPWHANSNRSKHT